MNTRSLVGSDLEGVRRQGSRTEQRERAHHILESTQAALSATPLRWGNQGQRSVGSQRLLAAAEKGDLQDRALWPPIAKALGGGGNSTALVSTAETVALALLDYYEIGVRTFLIRGFDPYNDAVDFGRELIPRVREAVRQRDASAQRDVQHAVGA